MGRRSVGVASTQLLERIVDQLEQSPLSITSKCAQVQCVCFCLLRFTLSYFL